MAREYTLRQLTDDVLEKAGEPLTAEEIWEKAREYGLDKQLEKYGKTPSASIGSFLYTNCDSEDSRYIKCSSRPSRFYFRNNSLNMEEIEKKIEKVENEKEKMKNRGNHFEERDLHPILVSYLKGNSHFQCHAKTIYHEESVKEKGIKGKNEWLHPDIVGVYFPFSYKPETLGLQKAMGINSIKLFSFEMKISLDFNNIRKCYFQAVSNSSWANEGYLVALKIDKNDDFINELNRLSNAFGIGIIELNIDDLVESEIICPARFNEMVDWETVDRLVEINPNFKTFIKNIEDDIVIRKVKSSYDKVLDDEALKKHIKEKNIIK